MVLFYESPELPLFDRLPGRKRSARRPSVIVERSSGQVTPLDNQSVIDHSVKPGKERS